ncbi:ABC transporter ATP-binding protein [Dactylosporangium salmoneum]|uniref:ABC transporter ATP-binding protein n=1 Tax=Dactylosporangium salmoneum TaxID=53361 RepID=A0ABN3I789_9ACTN
MGELWRTVAGHRLQVAGIVGAEAAVGAVEAGVHPLLLKALFDVAVVARDPGRFALLGAGYLALGVVINLATYAAGLWRRRFERGFAQGLEGELLRQALAGDARQVPADGSYVSRIHNDVTEGLLPAMETAVRIARQAATSAVLTGVLVYLSWQASLVLLVVFPPLVLLSNRLARRIEDNTGPEREAEARYLDVLTRTLAAFRALHGLPGLRPPSRAVNAEALAGLLGITYANHRLRLQQRTLSDLIMNLSDTASLIVGAFFVFAGRMSFGGFLAFVNSLWRAVEGIVGVINLIPQMRRSAAVLRRINALRGSATAAYHEPAALVAVRGVRVTYGPEATVAVADFVLHPGEHVLLRGPNGCGKTTLLQVVAGMLAPDAGTVALPPRVACLTAPVDLPPLPVGRLVPDPALRLALYLDDLAGQLPAQLSSGQRQRAGVGALLSEDADVYLADEPFANLDAAGRARVLSALESRTRGRGLVVVHHGDADLDGRVDRVVNLEPVARSAEPVHS